MSHRQHIKKEEYNFVHAAMALKFKYIQIAKMLGRSPKSIEKVAHCQEWGQFKKKKGGLMTVEMIREAVGNIKATGTNGGSGGDGVIHDVSNNRILTETLALKETLKKIESTLKKAWYEKLFG